MNIAVIYVAAFIFALRVRTLLATLNVPQLQQVGFGSTFIRLGVTDTNDYDYVRLYVDSVEILPTPVSWPVDVDDLIPGQSYTFHVVGHKSGQTSQSDNLIWCTNPEVPTNLHAETRFFYGFNIKFDAPSAGLYTGYEVWADIDSTWHKTLDGSGSYQEHYYYFNYGIDTDFTRTLNSVADVYGFTYSDFAYGLPRQSNAAIQSGSSYVIKARALHLCSVYYSGTSETDREFFSEPVISNAITGAHPVVKISTTPISDSEIEISFEPYSTYSADMTFNIYRYFNDTFPEQARIPNLTLSHLPFRDTGLQPASLYTYEISVVYKGYETFDYSRLALESEYWPGARDENAPRPTYPDLNSYYYGTNREQNWKDFYSYDGSYPTFQNIYDISSDNNIFHFYFREKTSCTYPPTPNLTFVSSNDSILLTWSTDDYSNAPLMQHATYGNIGVSTLVYLDGVLLQTFSDDADTKSYTYSSLAPKSSFTCKVVIALTCPDDDTFVDHFDYGSYYFDFSIYQFRTYMDSTRGPDPNDDLLSSDSGSNHGLDQTMCYTLPSGVTLLGISSGGEPETEVTVTYTQPHPGLTYEVTLTSESSESPYENLSVTSLSALSSQTITGLLPGQPYNVTVRSVWEVVPGVTAYSPVAPLTPTSDYVLLTSNGQTAIGDPVFVCTDPSNMIDLNLTSVNSTSVLATWKAPEGLTSQFQFDIFPDNVFASSVVVPGSGGGGAYSVANENFTQLFSGFNSVQSVNISVTIETGCGAYLPSKTKTIWQSKTTKPEKPVWHFDLCEVLSTSAIHLQFNNSASPGSSIYSVFRDGSPIVDAENNGTAKSITDDSDLQAGTIYRYRVVAVDSGLLSLPSEELEICTKPDPPSAVAYTNREATSFDLVWSAPAVGLATGYLLSDNLGNSNLSLLNHNFTYSSLSAVQKYNASIVILSYLDCNVTGRSSTRKLISDISAAATFQIPEYLSVPVWLPDLCISASSTSLRLQFNDSNADGLVVYTLYRDGTPTVDPDNNGTSKLMVDDTDLQPGTTYEYRVSAQINGESTDMSEPLRICTNPGKPAAAYYTNRSDAQATIVWSAPSVGSYSGFYLSDNMGNINLSVDNPLFTYTGLVGSVEHRINVSLWSYSECNVTGTLLPRELLSDSPYETSILIPIDGSPEESHQSSVSEDDQFLNMESPYGVLVLVLCVAVVVLAISVVLLYFAKTKLNISLTLTKVSPHIDSLTDNQFKLDAHRRKKYDRNGETFKRVVPNEVASTNSFFVREPTPEIIRVLRHQRRGFPTDGL